MGATYSRQSSFSDGDTINSSLFNNEYDQLVAAFASATGHTHDGTTGEGGVITKVGPAQELTVSGSSVLPKTSNAIDLGSSTYKFKDAYFAGDVTADGSITYNGNVVLGSDATDTLTINATIQGSSLVFEGATADAYELTLAIPDATADVTVTLPNATDTLVGKATTDTLTNKTLTSPTLNTPTITGHTTFSDGAYNFDVASHDGTNGLKLGGTLVTATATELNLMDGVTSTTAELNILDGVTSTAAELNILDGVTSTSTELNLLDGVTATTTELNKIDGFTGTYADLNYAKDLNATGVTTSEFDILDGLTSTTAELNILDGVTSTTAELNILDGVTSTATELNLLDGVTSTTAELNILDGVTATYTELNILDGVTSTAAELNILDGVTSTATEINLLDGITAIKDEDNMSSDSATSLATQQSIKAYVDAQVDTADTLAEMTDTTITTPADSHFLVHNGTKWVNETGTTARTSLGVDAAGTINYTHPSGDGNSHVPANSTTNNGKVLTASAVAGTYTWETPSAVGISDVVDDTTPQLGGSLDVNGNSIVSASNGDIAITPHGTGDVVLDGLKYPSADGTAGYVLKTDGSAQLSWVAQTTDTDTDTTYTAGDGLALASEEFTLDLTKDQSWTGSQRGTPSVVTDGTLDLNTANNFKYTPAASPDTLEFTNETAGQSGFITVINASGHTIATGSEVKKSSTWDISTAGTYLVSYYSDGTNVYLSASAALAT